LDKVSIAVKTFGVCDFSRSAVTDWRLRRWRLCFLALLTATRKGHDTEARVLGSGRESTLIGTGPALSGE